MSVAMERTSTVEPAQRGRGLLTNVPPRQRAKRSNNPLSAYDLTSIRGRRIADLLRCICIFESLFFLEFLAEKAGAIRALAKNVVRDVIEIGRHLSEAKARVRHGAWYSWLENEFGWSEDTALNFMRTFEAFGANPERVRDISLPLKSFYKLAAPSTPQSARDKALERAKGEQLSHSEVQKIIDNAKAEERKAAEIRMRAERRLGEMLREQKETVGLSEGGRPSKTCNNGGQVSAPSLKDVGIDRKPLQPGAEARRRARERV